jgi:hypothetical protein
MIASQGTVSGGRRQIAKDAFYPFAAIFGGIGFYFTIIGVFELLAASLSLALFIALMVSGWVFQRDDVSP